jgi:hypothetical protein
MRGLEEKSATKRINAILAESGRDFQFCAAGVVGQFRKSPTSSG